MHYHRGMETVITLLIVGAVLVFLETVLPGMIAGVAGMICLIVGVVMSYHQFGPQTGNWILLGVLAGLLMGTVLWVKYFPQCRVGRIFVSRRTVGEIGTEKPELRDQTGIACSPLRPSGLAVINGKRVDVITEGPHIERGTPVKVVAVEGLRVVVRAG